MLTKDRDMSNSILEDFDGGHLEKCPKMWVRPNLYGVNILILDQWDPLNKMIPLMEDHGGGGGCTVTPLGPWTNNLSNTCLDTNPENMCQQKYTPSQKLYMYVINIIYNQLSIYLCNEHIMMVLLIP